MANNVTVNPWILDTASTVVTAKRVRVEGFLWDGVGAVSGDVVQLTDRNSNVIWQSGLPQTTTPIINSPTMFPDSFDFDGISTGTISRGKIYVYVKNFGT